jgi:hypothetical protein
LQIRKGDAARQDAEREKTMKCLVLAAAMISSTAFAADVYVQPYQKADGTYVPGHYRSEANGTPFDNYSAKGNVNPYTGQAGTVNPYQPTYPQQQRRHCYKDAYGNVVCQ